jgi:pimeloyl-ACP methyl ester carboxylesterase
VPVPAPAPVPGDSSEQPASPPASILSRMRRLPAPPLPAFITAQLHPDVHRYRVDVGGHEMHVMELGPAAGRPVLLVHGNPTWGFLYRDIASALAGQGLRCIMPDLIGLGLSDKPRSSSAHTLDAHGRWLGALIAGLELEPLIFVGQDWGGPVGLRALADMPARLAGMVLLNTVVGPPKPGFRPTAFHRFARLPLISDLVFRGLGFPQLALWTVQGDKQTMRGDVGRAYWWPLRALADRVAPLAMARMVPDSLAHPSIAALQRCQELVESFRGPAAIVWGDRDPVLGTVRNHIARLLPEAPVTRTAAGHFLQEEVPEQITAAILRVNEQLGR